MAGVCFRTRGKGAGGSTCHTRMSTSWKTCMKTTHTGGPRLRPQRRDHFRLRKKCPPRSADIFFVAHFGTGFQPPKRDHAHRKLQSRNAHGRHCRQRAHLYSTGRPGCLRDDDWMHIVFSRGDPAECPRKVRVAGHTVPRTAFPDNHAPSGGEQHHLHRGGNGLDAGKEERLQGSSQGLRPRVTFEPLSSRAGPASHPLSCLCNFYG